MHACRKGFSSRFLPQECFQEQIVHDMLDVPVSQIVEETVEVVTNGVALKVE